MQRALIYFLLNCYLIQFLVLFYTMLITLFIPFSTKSTAFSRPKKLQWTGISSPYPAPRLIRFQ